jgi:PAS domain S-box-containing protein
VSTTPASGTTTTAPLISLFARTPRLIDLLPSLHQHAINVTHGDCSLLLEHNPRSGLMQATSGVGLEALRTDPWMPGPGESAIVAAAFDRSEPTLVADLFGRAPGLASQVGTSSALLLPLVRGGDRLGLLVIGFRRPPRIASIQADAAEIGDAFLLALELCRLRQKDELQRDLRELLHEFAGSPSATLTMRAGLDAFCEGANRLFGADRASVWIHDRRARHLVLEASSDPARVVRGSHVTSEDALTLAALAMRHTGAEIVPNDEEVATSTVTVPLRGCRRALGTIVFEGVRIEPGNELDLLDRADELGRQLSSTIENIQLLDDLLRSRRELENTFDSIADLVAVSDRSGRIVHVNLAFAARIGLPRDELLDRALSDTVGPDLASWLVELEAAAVRPLDQAAPTREIADPVLNGTFVVTVTDLLNTDRARVGSVIVARDSSLQSMLEAEREQLRQRLVQSEKLVALGQFVAGIAHELNNPLQGVLGHLELLRATAAFPRELRGQIQTIYREADRAAKIVRNLLVFAGSRRLTRRSVSLNRILQKVLALRAPARRAADIEVVRRYDEKLPRVQGDPLLLHQAFLNIVMNAEQAVAATGRPGRVEISTAVANGGDRIVAAVGDTGPGIPADVLSRIFEPFYTTKEVGKGTGLGLAIAYGIVQEHGGRIVAANQPGGGAVFTVELPAYRRQDVDA